MHSSLHQQSISHSEFDLFFSFMFDSCLGDHRIPSPVLADDVALLAPSSSLSYALERFAAESEVAWKEISTIKSKAIVLSWKKVSGDGA